MKNYEFSLVVFTTLSQMAVGLAVLAAWQGKSRGASPDAYKVWGLITLIMGVALGASLFHLGHPLRAYHAGESGCCLVERGNIAGRAVCGLRGACLFELRQSSP